MYMVALNSQQALQIVSLPFFLGIVGRSRLSVLHTGNVHLFS